MARQQFRRGNDDAASTELRTPPHSVEAEQSVLGGLMLDPLSWDNVADVLRPEDFYRLDHRTIFDAIGIVAGLGRPADAVTVGEQLTRTGKLEEVGGLAYLGTLVRDTPSAEHVRTYADIVRERSLLRRLLHAGSETASSVFVNEGETARELVDRAEQRIFEIAEAGTRGRLEGAVSVKTLMPALIDQIDDWHANPDKLRGLPTGFDEFDRKTGGLRPGDLVVVAGRPSMGKTTFAVNMAEYAALKSDVKASVAIFSMEMPSEQLMTRMLSSIGRVPLSGIRSGQIAPDDWPRITGAAGQLSEARIFIDETPALNPTELRARARRLKREHGLDMVVVDYLQLMQVPGNKENRATEIAEISRGLKALAKELSLPVIALSQLNRGVEQRQDKKPVMSDLRECVTGDTRVWLTSGERVAIRDLVGTTPEVWSLDENQKIVARRSDLVWSVGAKAVSSVRLASGRSIRATAEHRLLCGTGWQTVAEIRPGDRMAIARRLPERKPAASWTQRARTLLGWALADGIRQPALAGAAASHFKFAPGRATLSDYTASLGSPSLKTWSESVLFWDRVVAVEPAGVEEVFDLTVPGTANWLADGIVTHNSGAIEQDADMILLIYREEVYDKNTTKRGIAEIDLAKHRNGETGTFMLTFQGQYSRFSNYAPDSYAEGVLR